MDLTHTFTVPTTIDATWAHFQDIGALAECFPGAQVTAVGEDADGAPTFEGTCKVKLGPIALVYAGAGSFVERDEGAHRFVVDAKGRDKRGNGTAGAKVTVTMTEPGDAGGQTTVEVVTDLAITGKPAQFGRGVMQDVSDKLLGQFVACLEQRLADEPGAPDQDSGQDTTPSPAPDAQAGPKHAAPPPDDDALDLGAAVIPVLIRSYGKKVVIGLGALLVLLTLVRRLRR
ncbi:MULTISPECIES: SRPBCC family protein [unclassified Nocardioides]|uniref:SRPBCC family protein n=1 Tax=unclassified Nocardioides TaxID=2615069 RepID=UPI0006FC2606|nr:MULTISPECIES: SRPBCC family protein [unclassified Nocardioides]KRA38264.1 carbon monoxide dehydrogenase [Nocardioides sp. Root614]KRA92224.1 carbon monoxide dehydrogenase [Nocardioides sp. Root682]